MPVFGGLSQLYLLNILVQICTSFTNEQIEITVTSKFVAMTTSCEVKVTLFLTF